MLNFSVQDFLKDSLQDSQVTDAWNVIETEFNPHKLHHKETVFTLSNGYLGTRGTFPEGYPGDCAATYINGVYDDVPVGTKELAQAPNWLPLIIKVDGETFRLDTGKILNYERRLDLRLGLLSRDVRWCSPSGHTIDLHFEQFVSFADCHVMAIRCLITSVDFTGNISVEIGFDAEPITNEGMKHWHTIKSGITDNSIWLHSQTIHSQIQLGMAAQLVVEDKEHTAAKSVDCVPGQTISLEKIVTIFTSRETANPFVTASNHLSELPSYTTLLAAHIAAWAQIWENSDIVIEGDIKAQLSVRFSLFQLLAAAPRNSELVSIPPKTLSGFAYRGHIFWDTEVFALPFFTLTQPAIAKNLLSYRYHTLAGARRKAIEAGYKGAMYAWESADTGDETTPRWVQNAAGESIRIWCGDIEVHISTDVAYAIWQYWKATGDNNWMHERGAEIILDTAIFWESRVEWNCERCGYDILNVIGPDENHDCINNNAFTNIMVRWHLRSALQIWQWLEENYPDTAANLTQQLYLDDTRRDRWTEIAERLYINQDAESGLIEQFEGFFELEDVDLASYEPRTKSMQGLLGVEATNQKQILKQPDVLMLLCLLRDNWRQVVPPLHYDHRILQNNWNYYSPRTDHTYGSSLGPAIHAIVACDLNQPDEAYTHFLRAALVDLEDTRNNASEGIHAASAGGVWQAVVFGFAGIHMTSFGPIACPNLPPTWKRLQFKLQWQNHCYEFDLKSGEEESHREFDKVEITAAI
jgi:trehalose/maltose hydrolase-like predicted phosphorylase